MVEVPAATKLARPKEEALQSLEPVDRENLSKVISQLSLQSKAEGLEIHLLLVGSSLGVQKKSTPREEDLDLVVYSPELSVETISYTRKEYPKFRKFEAFIRRALSPLGTRLNVIEPYADTVEWGRGDTLGSIKFIPSSGKTIEIIPLPQTDSENTLEEYLNTRKEPYSVLL